jgi:hypothetical protein
MLVDQMVERGCWFSKPRPAPRCRRCGSTDVYWLNLPKRARKPAINALCDWGTEHPHLCQPTAEGFEDISNA